MKSVEITIAKSAGFCFGVKRAVTMALSAIDKLDNVVLYGEIVNNKFVNNHMTDLGAIVVHNADEIPCNSNVIIRAHGVSPEIHDALNNKMAKCIDCTCPFVKKIHDIVRRHSKQKDFVIIIGDPAHPEVIGINGWTGNKAFVASCIDDVSAMPISRDRSTVIVAQTTFIKSRFEEIVTVLKQHIDKIIVYPTMCEATETRQKEAYDIAVNSDVMIVVGDRSSSNTKKLCEICRRVCPSTYLVESIDGLYGIKETMKNISVIGITAGASTPQEKIEEIVCCLKGCVFG